MSANAAGATTRCNLVSELPSPRGVSLVSNDQVRDVMGMLRIDYEEMLEDLRSSSTEQLRSRVRAYDNSQRLTLGRAQTARANLAVLRSKLSWDSFHRLDSGSPDQSFFPKDLEESRYPGVWSAIQYSIEHLVSGGDFNQEQVLVTAFCHRVLVRPGEHYPGFLHRDLPAADGRIGTAVWYPRVDSKLIDGAQLFAFETANGHEIEDYRGLAPDYVFDSSVYAEAVLMLAYPMNFVHGVSSGRNHAPGAAEREADVIDFLQPTYGCFTKDLTIVTVSSESPVEE